MALKEVTSPGNLEKSPSIMSTGKPGGRSTNQPLQRCLFMSYPSDGQLLPWFQVPIKNGGWGWGLINLFQASSKASVKVFYLYKVFWVKYFVYC